MSNLEVQREDELRTFLQFAHHAELIYGPLACARSAPDPLPDIEAVFRGL